MVGKVLFVDDLYASITDDRITSWRYKFSDQLTDQPIPLRYLSKFEFPSRKWEIDDLVTLTPNFEPEKYTWSKEDGRISDSYRYRYIFRHGEKMKIKGYSYLLDENKWAYYVTPLNNGTVSIQTYTHRTPNLWFEVSKYKKEEAYYTMENCLMTWDKRLESEWKQLIGDEYPPRYLPQNDSERIQQYRNILLKVKNGEIDKKEIDNVLNGGIEFQSRNLDYLIKWYDAGLFSGETIFYNYDKDRSDAELEMWRKQFK
jgi:hypothetical protein